MAVFFTRPEPDPEISDETDPDRSGSATLLFYPGEGELCVTSLISKEDHGYITDIGCSTTKGFLSNKAAQK